LYFDFFSGFSPANTLSAPIEELLVGQPLLAGFEAKQPDNKDPTIPIITIQASLDFM
jgi:hypothetical protein